MRSNEIIQWLAVIYFGSCKHVAYRFVIDSQFYINLLIFECSVYNYVNPRFSPLLWCRARNLSRFNRKKRERICQADGKNSPINSLSLTRFFRPVNFLHGNQRRWEWTEGWMRNYFFFCCVFIPSMYHLIRLVGTEYSTGYLLCSFCKV